MPATATGQLATPRAAAYLQQLCKHFGHKLETRFDDREGVIAFPGTEARLTADAQRLTVTLASEDPAQLPRMREVVDSHLRRFAFREGVEGLSWSWSGDA